MSASVEPHATAPVPPAVKTAVFAIHGISPIQRYSFADQFAEGFLGALNAAVPGGWKQTAYWPPVQPLTTANGLRATSMRIFRTTTTADDPASPVFDVYEGYWSPLSKGKTNAASLLGWLLNVTFRAASATASIPATWKKLFWDLGYVGSLLGVAVLLLVVAVLVAMKALVVFAASFGFASPGIASFVDSPVQAALRLPVAAYVELFVNVAAAYVFVELLFLLRSAAQRAGDKSRLIAETAAGHRLHKKLIDAASWHRWAIAAAVVIEIVLVALALLIAWMSTGDPLHAAPAVGLFVLAAGALRLARTGLDFVIENVLGDVQVYTTHDTTATLYGVREAIIATVAESLVGVLRAERAPNVPLYDRVHVAAHSLGTTIAVDILIRLRQMVQEGAITPAQWSIVRSFTSFGTSLEKTRFLTDVRHPTPTAAFDQWQNDIYGNLFTKEPTVLAEPTNANGIFWTNIWYERDVVANEIVSYRSDVAAGADLSTFGAVEREICENHELPTLWPVYAFIHSNYIGDGRFWQIVTPTLRKGGAVVV